MKQYRLKELDKDLLYIEKLAENMGVDIDTLPEWVALNALVTAYHMNERRYCHSFMVEYGKARHIVMVIIGGC